MEVFEAFIVKFDFLILCEEKECLEAFKLKVLIEFQLVCRLQTLEKLVDESLRVL